MSKKTIFTGLLAILALISYGSYKSVMHNVKHQKKEIITQADARLSMREIQNKVENKIDFIYENVAKNDATLTDKEIKSLIEELNIIRAYGKDISEEAKIKLLKVVKILANKHEVKNIELLKELKDIAITSQTLTA